MIRIRLLAPALALGLALTACERQSPPATSANTTPAATQPTAEDLAAVRSMNKPQATAAGQRTTADQSLPVGHPPMDGRSAAMKMPPPRAGAANLKYTAPATWEKQPVRSNLRADQYKLPRVEGDAEDGELAVFTAGIGGGPEANIERWKGQFTTPDGQPIPPEAFVREEFEANGLKITLVDIAGRFNAGAMAMAGSAAGPKDNYRMLGAIVETPDGPWFFKATGPSATMGAHRAEFVEFLKSMRTPGTESVGTSAPAMSPAGEQ